MGRGEAMTHPTKSQLEDLLARVEKADGPDRELDAMICATLRYADNTDVPMGDWRSLNFPVWRADRLWVQAVCDNGDTGASWISEPLTASLDAAIAFCEAVLPGWLISLDDEADGTRGAVILPPNGVDVVDRRAGCAILATRPLALIAAILKALIQQTEEQN
jgi:hypothetical protein